MAEEELEAEMIRLLLRGLRQGSRDKALAKDAVAFIEANERSYQAVLWGGLVQGEAGDGKGHLVTLDYAIRLDATGGLAYLHKARLQHWRGDFVEADLTIDQGLLHNPRSPALLIAQGDIALARGALSQADWAARQALEVDGGAVDARRLLASVLLAQGDERGRAGEEALAMAGGVSLPSRLRFGRDHAEALINRGRVAAGVALGRKTVAMAVAGGDYGQAVRVLAGLSSTANLLGRWGELKELTARIGEMAGQPEVADTDRDFMIASRVRFDGLAAVGLGDLEGGKRALARLEAIPAERVPYHSTDTYGRGLKVAIAVAEGRYPEAITEARKLPSPCRGPYKLGQVLLKSGEEEGARAAFERVAARRTRCFRRSHYAGPAYAGALAQLVKLAIEDNGPDAVKRARDNLLGFQAFWPSPDPDLPMARLIQNSRGHVPIK